MRRECGMSEVPARPFWMVYGIGQREPAYRHEDYDSAAREASRLARNHPGTAFVVLEAITAVIKSDLIMRRYRAPLGVGNTEGSDDIPF